MDTMRHAFALFATPIGTCAVVWSRRGIAAVQLPQTNDAAMQAHLRLRWPEAEEDLPPPGIDLALRDITRLLSGEAVDLARVALDMDGVPEFHRRVYAVALTIPPGETRTYGEIATGLGDPGAARAVGQALGQNPFAIVVPCHRVLAAGGKSGGFSARGGVTTKLRILSIERARTSSAPSLFDAHGGLPLAAGR